ncbi:GspE/PulE family protein [Lentisphaerota bacterium ZTH]|nr:type II/IV secretion system protein [Lentisphaerota bacterium]WET05541.1 GspE/PulE family protein [Lentisphaerota bacterium ZTH]
MSNIDIKKVVVPQEVLDLIPGSVARRLNILPLTGDEDNLLIASTETDNYAALDQLENLTARTVEVVEVKDSDALEKAVRRYYPADLTGNTADNANLVFDRIVNRALQLRASDIHIVPLKHGGIVRMRIDGQMRSDLDLEEGLLAELTSVIKIAAELDIAERRTPLDGNINMDLFGEQISLRVATIPTIHGEHITLRLLTQDDSEALEKLAKLGMDDQHYQLLRQSLEEPNGIILLSGPTGSGKTTTLYASLRYLRESGKRHLVSIEDPVEKPVHGVTQIKVDSESERVTFNKALRSVLRHDPDVIMVGEIRDGETGDIAVKSALTGHLVLSTLHTNSASGVITRLLNLDIAPFMVASTLRLAIAQRLVRTPCTHCIEFRQPAADECREFGWDENDKNLKVATVKGCSFCGNTGYSGRLGLYEMIPVDRNVRKMIIRGSDEHDFADYAFNKLKLPSLKEDGAMKILAGKTTVEEVRAITSTST